MIKKNQNNSINYSFQSYI